MMFPVCTLSADRGKVQYYNWEQFLHLEHRFFSCDSGL